MDKTTYSFEGITIETDDVKEVNKNTDKARTAYIFKMLRKESGMTRADFSVWLGVPYRTMQEWELGRRSMPEYVLRLIAYKVMAEKKAGRIGKND